jgi:adenylate kinase family enzyme
METYDIQMIGTGDLLRWNVDNQTEVGKVAEEYICKGGQYIYTYPNKLFIKSYILHTCKYVSFKIYDSSAA